MSDMPTKTYPPAFLKAIIDEAAAEASTTTEGDSGMQQGNTMSEISTTLHTSLAAAEFEALRRDARRYRWLRGMIYDDRIIVAADQMLHGKALDAAIDAAVAEEATTTEDALGIQQGTR